MLGENQLQVAFDLYALSHDTHARAVIINGILR